MTRGFTLGALAALLTTAACTTGGAWSTREGPEEDRRRSDVDAALPEDDGGPVTDAAVADAQTPLPTGCAARARWIYLLTFDQLLYRYDPSNDHEMMLVGRVRCPDAPSGDPFDTNSHNMTVDRSGRAWLVNQGGALYHVDTEDASCTGASFEVPQEEFEFLGATFHFDPTSESTSTPEEVLFVSGGPANVEDAYGDQIGVIDTDALTLTRFPRPTEAGTQVLVASDGRGNLWGSFIEESEGPEGRQEVQLKDLAPETGAPIRDAHAVPMTFGFQASYLFWGGRFYFFLPDSGDPGGGTLIYVLTPDPPPGTRRWELVHSLPDDRIVGSGVSTCAPTVLI